MNKKILIIGGGGREHALGWKLSQSKNVSKLYFAPGNGGTASLGRNIPIAGDNITKLIQFAKMEGIDLTVVGPEDSLSLGVVDRFNKNGLKIFGPSRKAAKLESSKGWCAKFMKRHNIPAPEFEVFSSLKKAISFVKSCPWTNLVIKADGLALGKGVVLPKTKDEAVTALRQMIQKGKFGAAGKTVIIQERLYGTELSVIALCDGKDIKVLSPAQDYKRVNDEDKGPNTGGMGACAPVPLIEKGLLKKIEQQILLPTAEGMADEGVPFTGVLYAGLMLTCEGPKVLEYNVRFGDPETQTQMMMLKSDLLDHLMACVEGRLNKEKLKFFGGYAVAVVLASGGYPDFYTKGQLLHGLDQELPKDIMVFHAGTKLTQGQHFSEGGRVLCVTTRASSLKKAVKRVYEAIDNKLVYFKSMHYRTDIAQKVLSVKKLKLVILISGTGTTMESIIKGAQNGVLSGVEVVGVISSDKSAPGIKKAEKLGVRVIVLNPEDDNFADELLRQLDSWSPDLISQNGWLPLTPKKIVKKYKGKIINQHPAPLDPDFRNGIDSDFGGEGMYGLVPHAAVIQFRKLVHASQPSGYAKRYIPMEATVHLVTENFDEGDVISREELVISDDDTAESLRKRLLPIEHKNVINAIKSFVVGGVSHKHRQKPLIREDEKKMLIKAKKRAIKKYLNH